MQDVAEGAEDKSSTVSVTRGCSPLFTNAGPELMAQGGKLSTVKHFYRMFQTSQCQQIP